MQKFASAVALAAGGCAYDVSLFIDKGKHFLIIVTVHFVRVLIRMSRR
jgi:hypothetical protein